ncbi:MAG: secondary thiamine-phosphate synthase enzyme YjbQ [Candidatus Methanofastidiosia archaeon]|jgi:secondary thiamine-phosphate synthase enzyme
MDITIKTNQRVELIDITQKVEKVLDTNSGILLVYCTHTTAGVYVNENESGLTHDVIDVLNQLVPPKNYQHNRIDNNADSHLKAILIGNSAVIPVRNGRLQLGTWQKVFFCEFDGPRSRKVSLTVVPDTPE